MVKKTIKKKYIPNGKEKYMCAKHKKFFTERLIEWRKEIIKSKIPMDRFGLPKDVANTVIFLSSEEASYITGQTIHVNGGMYMS